MFHHFPSLSFNNTERDALFVKTSLLARCSNPNRCCGNKWRGRMLDARATDKREFSFCIVKWGTPTLVTYSVQKYTRNHTRPVTTLIQKRQDGELIHSHNHKHNLSVFPRNCEENKMRVWNFIVSISLGFDFLWFFSIYNCTNSLWKGNLSSPPELSQISNL